MLRRHARSGPLVHYHIITSAVARAGQKRNELLVHADGSRRRITLSGLQGTSGRGRALLGDASRSRYTYVFRGEDLIQSRVERVRGGPWQIFRRDPYHCFASAPRRR
jgi:hypothetical protein